MNKFKQTLIVNLIVFLSLGIIFILGQTVFSKISLFFLVIGAIIGILIFLDNRHPSKTAAWIAVLVLQPFLRIYLLLFIWPKLP
ncbi:MAG: hypothetical protein LRY73_03450 [Bacillus sp. (in: Bacteria)]|nr:hypothetical protein [Bacillus sp. (in: firmicutes)]